MELYEVGEGLFWDLFAAVDGERVEFGSPERWWCFVLIDRFVESS